MAHLHLTSLFESTVGPTVFASSFSKTSNFQDSAWGVGGGGGGVAADGHCC